MAEIYASMALWSPSSPQSTATNGEVCAVVCGTGT